MAFQMIAGGLKRREKDPFLMRAGLKGQKFSFNENEHYSSI